MNDPIDTNLIDSTQDLPIDDLVPEALGPQKPWFGDDQALLRLALILGSVFFVWKLCVALIANPIWEEGHFAISGLYPALGYPDIPSGFALLSRPITAVFGLNLMPLRLLALMIATAIPFGIYYMASAITNKRYAIWAAILSMLVAPLGISGTIYYPEGSLQLLFALMLGALIRAIKSDDLRLWAMTGLFAALGLFIHYRFLICGLGIIAFALIFKEGRRLWLNRGFWLAGGIAFLGLIPSILYNMQNDYPAIAFHLVNRPDWRPRLGLYFSFIETQISFVSLVFFIAMFKAVPQGLRSKVDGHRLLVLSGALIFGIYLMQSPFNQQIMPHWPFLAYVPLIVFLPEMMMRFCDKARSLSNRRLRQGWLGLGLIWGLALGVVITAYQWGFANSLNLPWQWRKFNLLQNENWALFKPEIDAAITATRARFGSNTRIALAVSGHIEAVRLEFPNIGYGKVYALGGPDDVKTRFEVARKAWGLDLNGLMRDYGGQAVVIGLSEPSYLYHTTPDTEFRQNLCHQLSDIKLIKTASIAPGKIAMAFYSARVVKPFAATKPRHCALLPDIYVAQPQRGEFMKLGKDRNFFGMAADEAGIDKVDIYLDDQFVMTARHGLDPEGARAPKVLDYDPDYPRVQFDFNFREQKIARGEHSLTIKATTRDGRIKVSEPRTLYVE